VQFAARGCETKVRLWNGAAPAEGSGSGSWRTRADLEVCPTLAVSTESRGLAAECLPAIFAEAARRLPEARLVFKKIDSTLRGNVGAEVALAAQAFGCDAAVITPAFPAMGRTVVEGVLRVGAFASVEMAAYWREQELGGCAHMACDGLSDALAAGARFVSLEAGCNEDLDSIVAAGLASQRRILWVGSAGLAAALARALVGKPATHGEHQRRPEVRATQWGGPPGLPCLFCIGSNHAVTTEQARNLLDARPSVSLSAEDADPAQVSYALAGGRHVALRIPYGRVPAERLAPLIAETRAPIFVTGGDTASLAWRSLGIREALLDAEISAGIPLSLIRRGLLHGAPLVTKSGGFGGPGALVEIADYFYPL